MRLTSRRVLALGAGVAVIVFGAVLVLRPRGQPPLVVRDGIALTPILESVAFDKMVDFQMVPGSEQDAVVLTQPGLIWRVSLDESESPAVFGDVSDRVIEYPEFEEGLLGLAFSPSFEQDQHVYLHYTAGDPMRNVIARFRMRDGALDPASEQVLLEVPRPTSMHNGGQIAFGPDGYLYIALGDGGSEGDQLGLAQDLSTLRGSILRIDVSGDAYSIPPDNPFVDQPDARPEVYAYGLRNPWRFAFDAETGALWAADVGDVGWEEINQIEPGGNYGWNVREGFGCFQAKRCESEGLIAPRVAYTRDQGCAVIGGQVYHGDAMPDLDGWYVYGDMCSGTIWAVDTAGDAPPEVLLPETGLPVVSFGELPDGELVLVTFANALYRLAPEGY